MSQSDQCLSCAHYRTLMQCDAFPCRIPVEILTGQFDHTEPYPGDRGIMYEPLIQVEKEEARDYKQEYRDYHGKPKQRKERAERNAARAKMGLKVGDPREADHKRPLSQGGSNSKRNLRAVSRSTNRRKGAKRE